jgi:uncharacterized iron-regulated membrane protein
MHRFPFDPWWTFVVFLASLVATVYAVGERSSDLVVMAIALAGIMAGTFGIDRWIERHRPRRRAPRR